MSKTTIEKIRKAINECPEVVGKMLETAFNSDDAILFKMLIEGEMARKEHFEPKLRKREAKHGD